MKLRLDLYHAPVRAIGPQAAEALALAYAFLGHGRHHLQQGKWIDPTKAIARQVDDRIGAPGPGIVEFDANKRVDNVTFGAEKFRALAEVYAHFVYALETVDGDMAIAAYEDGLSPKVFMERYARRFGLQSDLVRHLRDERVGHVTRVDALVGDDALALIRRFPSHDEGTGDLPVDAPISLDEMRRKYLKPQSAEEFTRLQVEAAICVYEYVFLKTYPDEQAKNPDLSAYFDSVGSPQVRHDSGDIGKFALLVFDRLPSEVREMTVYDVETIPLIVGTVAFKEGGYALPTVDEAVAKVTEKAYEMREEGALLRSGPAAPRM